MSSFQPYTPVHEQLSTEQLRGMAAELNKALRCERSRISTRERVRLDRIAGVLYVTESGSATAHPRFVQFVENCGSRLYLGLEEISYAQLLDRSLEEHFGYKYFSRGDINFKIGQFCQYMQILTSPPPLARDEIDPRYRDKPMRPISELMVEYLCGVYRQVFNLPPYLGGVGAAKDIRAPHSPFFVFLSHVFDGLGIRTRNGSRYSPETIKNLMPPGGLLEHMPEDDDELVEARRELELELESKRSEEKRRRGRPRKAVAPLPAQVKSTPDTK